MYAARYCNVVGLTWWEIFSVYVSHKVNFIEMSFPVHFSVILPAPTWWGFPWKGCTDKVYWFHSEKLLYV